MKAEHQITDTRYPLMWNSEIKTGQVLVCKLFWSFWLFQVHDVLKNNIIPPTISYSLNSCERKRKNFPQTHEILFFKETHD